MLEGSLDVVVEHEPRTRFNVVDGSRRSRDRAASTVHAAVHHVGRDALVIDDRKCFASRHAVQPNPRIRWRPITPNPRVYFL